MFFMNLTLLRPMLTGGVRLRHAARRDVPSCHVYVCPTTPPRRHAAVAVLIPCSAGPHYSAEVLLYTCNAVPVRLHPSHPTCHPLPAFAMASSFSRTSSICPWTSVPLCYVRVCTLGPARRIHCCSCCSVCACVDCCEFGRHCLSHARASAARKKRRDERGCAMADRSVCVLTFELKAKAE